MALCANCWLLRDGLLHESVLDRRNKKSWPGLRSHIHFVLTENPNLFGRMPHLTKIRPLSQPVECEKKERRQFDPSKIEPPPYEVYMDSTSGKLEPAYGNRASIPSPEYWPEGTLERVRAAQAPEPKGVSKGSPSFGKSPGSRRSKRYNTQAKTSESADSSEPSQTSDESKNIEITQSVEVGGVDDAQSDTEEDEYVVYQTEKEKLTGYDLDKHIGNPHPFINPETARTIENIRSSDDLWWNWRRSERWSRWQRPRPNADTVLAKAMAETGQIKIFGDQPTVTETILAKSRKKVFKEERLKAERERLYEIGPIAYYSEWVSAYKDVDTSREAVQKRFEETGMTENQQLAEMFSHQTREEYRIMAGTDLRIKRDPLAIRMREELKKEIFGGDPVYPTVNYIRDPNEVVDYRGHDFHEPVPSPMSYLLENRFLTSAEDFEKMMAKEKGLEFEISAIDKAMSTAVDIGETDDIEESEEEKEEEFNSEEEFKSEGIKEEEFKDIGDNWSLIKTSPHIQKSKEKTKKNGSMTLKEAIEDSENLTDFIMDFDEEEE
ncbi:plastid transcriptionally active 12 [Carex rostrata]